MIEICCFHRCKENTGHVGVYNTKSLRKIQGKNQLFLMFCDNMIILSIETYFLPHFNRSLVALRVIIRSVDVTVNFYARIWTGKLNEKNITTM